MYVFVIYSLDVGRWEKGTERVDMFVHLTSSISFDSDVVYSLILNLFNVFTWFCFPPLSLFSSHFLWQQVVDFALTS